jgi:predicted negative regulator of RcsB-dependent stress response
MVQVYQTEDEQLEAVKKWFRDYGKMVVTAVVVVALLIFGGYSWQQRQHHQQEAASVDYQNLIETMRKLEVQSTPEALATAKHLADTLKKDYSTTTYAQFAALFKARLAVQAGDLGEAEAELRWVLDHKPAQEIKWLAQLRLARVLYAKGDSKGALALLDENAAGGYAAAVLQVKGDIASAGGDAAGARAAYQKARELESKQVNPANDPLLEMKLRDLGVQVDTPTAKVDADNPNTDEAQR